MSGIKSWNTSNVEHMERMFKNSRNFANDLSTWEVEKIGGQRPDGFSDGVPEGQMIEPIWNKSLETEPEEKPTVPEEKPEEGNSGGEEQPIVPEEPTTPEKPETPEGKPEEVNPPETDPEEKPTEPQEPESPKYNIDDSICPCNGNTLIDFPVDKGDVLVDFRAEARIACFESQPSVMKPIEIKNK